MTTFKILVRNFSKLEDIVLLRATRKDRNEILKLKNLAYYPTDPLSVALDLKPNSVLQEQTVKALNEGLTIIARKKRSCSIIGACISETTRPWDPKQREVLAKMVQCPKVRSFVLFQAHLMRLPNLHQTYSTRKVFEIRHLLVKPDPKQEEIAYLLAKRALELGQNYGYKILRCDCTSDYAAKACEKLNMNSIAEIPYSTYLMQEMLKAPSLNESCKVFIKVV